MQPPAVSRLRDLRGLHLRDLRGPLRYVADALLALTLAPRCAACARTLDRPTLGPVCETCWAGINRIRPPVCHLCGDPLASWRMPKEALGRCPRCRQRPSVIDACRAAGHYEGALRDVVHAFKYEGRRTLASQLGGMLRDAGGDVLVGADCAVPVPLHPWRRFRRGFNQATDLARGLNLPVVHALWRTRATAPQTGLTAGRRRHNVRGAFSISPLVSGRMRRSLLTGRIVVLVDDVRTTGATLEACAGVLRAAGVAEVRALTVARADLTPSRLYPSATSALNTRDQRSGNTRL